MKLELASNILLMIILTPNQILHNSGIKNLVAYCYLCMQQIKKFLMV